MIDAVLLPERVRQLDAAMNVGYNLKVAAQLDESLMIEHAASRGNPFAISASLFKNNSTSDASDASLCSEPRRQQLDSRMNSGYMEKLGKMSPTRMQAAARGNPFAIFETNSWKSSGQRLKPLNSRPEAHCTARFADPSETNCMRASAAAKGNPFASFGATFSNNQKIHVNNSGERVVGAATSAMGAAADGRGRLEASLVFAPNGSRFAATTGLPIRKKTQSKQLRPKISALATASGTALPKASAVRCTIDSDDLSRRTTSRDLDPQPADQDAKCLLMKRQPNHEALNVLLPVSPSECKQLHSLQNTPLEDEAPQSASAAISHAACGADAAPAAGDCRTIAESHSVGPAMSRSLDDNSEQHEQALEPSAELGVDFGQLSTSIDDLESQIRDLRDLMGVQSSTSPRRTRTDAEGVTAADATSARRPFSEGRVQNDETFDSCDLMSPKTLFPDELDYSSLSATRLPEEQSLARVVLQSLKLPPEVAAMVARCMKDTVMKNSATSAQHRANFASSAPRELVPCEAGIQSRCKSATQALVIAERAVQEQAARDAQKEEENFRRKVVAGMGKQRLCEYDTTAKKAI